MDREPELDFPRAVHGSLGAIAGRAESAVRATGADMVVALRDRPAWLQRWACPAAATRSVPGGRDGDGLDLDELTGVAEHSDADQRARHVVVGERGGDLVPGGD